MIDRRQALKLMLATPALSHLALGRTPQNDPLSAKISSAMQGFVADGKLVCAVGFVFQRGRLLFENGVGYSDLAAETPIRTDAIFDVRSISKPVTAIGVMVLVDSGRISLNDPIERYLPEFRNVKVNSSGGLVSPKMQPTIFDLLTDTAGINAQLNESLTRSFALPLKEAVNRYATHPLEFGPGQKWEYSSAGFAILGRIIEVVSQQPFQSFMHERVFSPIGMQDSFFFPTADKVSRIPLMYILENGRLHRDALDVTRKGQLYAAPEFGLCTTGLDLEKLAQVFLNDGLSSGKRFLSSRAIRMMITRQVATDNPSLDMGLSWFLHTATNAPRAYPTTVGSFGAAGASGCFFWVDPERKITRIFLTQCFGTEGKEAEEFMRLAWALTDK
ncbi:MAG TPA: serine hydrolase domain-containing protein [Edaphobacter sp.]|nr:serine hydrolase domain-containing protein [Edaphobacter sp.]